MIKVMILKFCKLLVIILAYYLQIHGQANGKVFFGPCPEKKVKPDIDYGGFMGTWYQLARFGYKDDWSKCYRVYFKRIDTLNALVNITYQPKPFDRNLNQIVGVLTIPNPEDSCRKMELETGYKHLKFLGISTIENFWVLDTDYYRYAVVWSCIDLKILNIQHAWILTRDRYLPKEIPGRQSIKELIVNSLVQFKLIPADFRNIDQKNCSN